jgi:hypothetical protein
MGYSFQYGICFFQVDLQDILVVMGVGMRFGGLHLTSPDADCEAPKLPQTLHVSICGFDTEDRQGQVRHAFL